MLPGLAPVGAPVNAVPVADAALGLVLPGSQPDHVGVVGVQGGAAQRVGAVMIEDRPPGSPSVGGLPEAAGRGGDVPDTAVARIDRDVSNAARREGRSQAA